MGLKKVAVTLANYFVLKHQVDVVVLKNTGDLINELDGNVNLISFDIKSMKKELFGLK